MRNFGLIFFFCFCFLCCGFFMGYVLGDAPRVDKSVRLNKQLKDTQREVDILKKRCVDWSHYVWKLETDRQSTLGDTGEFKD